MGPGTPPGAQKVLLATLASFKMLAKGTSQGNHRTGGSRTPQVPPLQIFDPRSPISPLLWPLDTINGPRGS